MNCCWSVLSGGLARRCEGGVGGGVARESRLQMLPESSSSQVTVGSWIARMEERGMQGVEERSWGEFARDRVDRQQFRQEEPVPRIVDVCIVVRGLRVLTDSSSSPRLEGRGMLGMSVAEVARLIVVRDSELAGAKWVS